MATKNTDQNLRDIEKAVVKLRNKLKRVDLDYTVQASVSSTDPTKVRYAVQITAPANGLAPITFIKDTPEELLATVKEAHKHIDYDEVEKAYHLAQIEACHRTIKTHEERINELAQPKEEVEPTPVAIEGAEEKLATSDTDTEAVSEEK